MIWIEHEAHEQARSIADRDSRDTVDVDPGYILDTLLRDDPDMPYDVAWDAAWEATRGRR
jgi:hypothetical protein